MPNSAILLKNIVIAPPAAQIYSRLGFKRATTSLSSGRRRETDRHMEEAASMIRLQGSFLRLSIRRNDGRLISLKDGRPSAAKSFPRFWATAGMRC